MRGRLRVRAVGAAVGVAMLAGCNAGQLQFRQDDRLSFDSPAARGRVTTPVTVRWSMRGFDIVGLDGSRDKGRGVFAVFVDRAPMAVGKDLEWLARDDTSCKRDPRCPDEKYLADRNVFVTTEPSLTIETLHAETSGRGDEHHYVNVVLLDGTGHRIGESAWYLPFTTKRRST